MPIKIQTHKDSRSEHSIQIPDSGPLPDTARTVSTIAGGATVGAIVAGPIGAILGAGVGGVLGLVATGHLHLRVRH